jgi:hypothetical protein
MPDQSATRSSGEGGPLLLLLLPAVLLLLATNPCMLLYSPLMDYDAIASGAVDARYRARRDDCLLRYVDKQADRHAQLPPRAQRGDGPNGAA